MLEPIQVIALFTKAKDVKTFAAGEVIYTAGDMGYTAFGLVEGEVVLQLKGKTVETITAGDLFGEGALVQETHDRMTTAVAHTAVKVAVVDREHFLFMVQETPLFALEVIRSLSTRLRQLKAKL